MGWVLGETLLTGIGQGYIQCTPLELCLMTAQLANGGFKIQPRIIDDGTVNYEDIKLNIDSQLEQYKKGVNQNVVTSDSISDLSGPKNLVKPLFRNPENVKFIKEAMFAVINEPFGTAYKQRIEDKIFNLLTFCEEFNFLLRRKKSYSK